MLTLPLLRQEHVTLVYGEFVSGQCFFGGNGSSSPNSTTLNSTCCFYNAAIDNATSSITLNPGCVNLTLINVALTSSFGVVIVNIGQTLAANPTAAAIVVTFANCTLAKGSILVIDSLGYAASSGGGPVPSVSISITGLSSTDGGLLLRGAFPAGTSILVANAVMTLTSINSPDFAAFGMTTNGIMKIIVLTELSLANASSLLFTNVSLTVMPFPASTNPLFICGTILVSNSSIVSFSTFSVVKVQTTGGNAVLITSGQLSISSNSIFQFVWCTFSSSTDTTFHIVSMPITVSRGSRFLFLHNVLNSSFYLYNHESSSVTVTSSSVWAIAASSFTDVSSYCSFVLSLSPVSVLNFSSWQISGNYLSARANSALDILSSPVSIANMSTLVLQSNTLVSEGSFAPLFYDEMITIGNWSWMLWAGNNFSSTFSSCISTTLVSNVVTVTNSRAYFSMLENKCRASTPVWWVTSTPAISGLPIGATGIFERCNSINGVVTVANIPTPFQTVSFVCGACNSSIDCFAPLTKTSVSCSSSAGIDSSSSSFTTSSRCSCQGRNVSSNLCLPADALAPPLVACIVANTVLSSLTAAVDWNCVNISYINVTLGGNVSLTVSIFNMLAANPTAAAIGVTFANCTLAKGSILVIDSLGYASSSGGGPAPSVTISITGLSSTDGGLLLRGAFPAGTSILVANVTMALTSMNLPTFSAFIFASLGVDASSSKALFLQNIELTGSSNLTLYNCSVAAENVAAVGILLTGLLRVSNKSAVVLSAVSVAVLRGSTYGYALLFQKVTVSILSNSTLVISQSKMSIASSTSLKCFGSIQSSVLVSNSSSWRLISSTFWSQLGAGWWFTLTPITILNGSSWSIEMSNFTGNNSYTSFNLGSADVTVSQQSVISWTGNLYATQDESCLKLMSVIVSISESSAFVVSSNSFWEFGTTTPASVAHDQAIQIGRNSWVAWSRNVMRCPDCRYCINSPGIGIACTDAGSRISFMENQCIGGASIWSGTTISVAAGAVGLLQRCNSLNGVVGTTGLPTPAIDVPGPCGSCNTTADCFSSLTANGSSCFSRGGGGGGAVCSCKPGGNGDLCLPIVVGQQPVTCTLNDTYVSEVGANVSVSNLCVASTYSNLTFAAMATLVVDVGSIMAAAVSVGTTSALSVVISKCTFLNGLILLLDASGYKRGASSSAAGASPTLSINITGLVGIDSGILIRGNFPPGTSIFISNVNFSISLSTVAPRFAAFDAYNPTYCKALFLASVSLSGGSSFSLRNASFIGSSLAQVLLYISGGLSISDASLLTLASLTVSLIGDQSAGTGTAVGIKGDTLNITNGSSLVISAATVTTVGVSDASFAVVQCQVTITNGSALVLANMLIQSGKYIAFLITSSPFAIQSGSQWVLSAMRCAASVTSWRLSASAITITGSSLLMVSGGSNFSSNQTAGIQMVSSPIVLNMSSTFILSSSLVASQAAGTPAMEYTSLAVGNLSWVLWTNNSFALQPGESVAACLRSRVGLNTADPLTLLDSGSYMSYIGNNCSGATLQLWQSTGTVARSSGAGSLFERCNYYANAIDTNFPVPFVILNESCGGCNASVDCYKPLTLGCSSQSLCVCAPGGYGDQCLPLRLAPAALPPPRCTLFDFVLSDGPLVIGSSCTNVSYINVTLGANVSLTVSIFNMLAANPTAAAIGVTFANCTLAKGSILVIDSLGYASSSGGPAPSVTISITGLSSTDGGLLLRGAFPAGTSILIANVAMTLTSLAAPTFAAYTIQFPSIVKAIVVSSLALVAQSNLSLSLVTVYSSGVPAVNVLFTDGVSLSGGSVLALDRVNSSSGPVSLGHCIVFRRPFLRISNGSSVRCTSLTVIAQSNASHGFLLFAEELTITNSSSWIVSGSNLQSVSYSALYVAATPTLVDLLSVWVVSQNVVVTANVPAVAFTASPFSVNRTSVWAFTRNSVVTGATQGGVWFDRPLVVGSSSWAQWAGNVMNVSSSSGCCVVPPRPPAVAIQFSDPTAYMSVAENTCLGPVALWCPTVAVYNNSASAAIGVLERCNSVNGATQVTTAVNSSTSTLLVGGCGSCNTSVDCFTPLAHSNEACFVQPRVCPCLPAGYGESCYPSDALAPTSVLARCVVANTVLSSLTAAVDWNCINISYINVTLGANVSLTVSIFNMLAANPTAAAIGVTFANCTLAKGSILVIDSLGYASSSGGGPAPPVTISITGLSSTDGGLLLRGAFPAGTSILVANAAMALTSLAAPTFGEYDGTTYKYRKLLVLMSMFLSQASSVSLRNVSLVATISSTNALLAIIGGLTLMDSSALLFSNITIGKNISTVGSFGFGFCFFSGSAIIRDRSQWAVVNSSFLAIAQSFSMHNVTMVIANNSQLVISQSLFPSRGSSSATASFLIQASQISITQFSSFTIDSCNLLSSASFASLTLQSSQITINSSSTLLIRRNMFASLQSSRAAVEMKACNISALEYSVIALTGNVFSADMTSTSAFTNDLPFLVWRASWLLWSANNFTAPASSSCLSGSSPSIVINGRHSYASFLNNSCSANLGGWWASTPVSVDFSSGALGLFERCNTLSGAVGTRGLAQPFQTISGSCSSCNVTYDCFQPFLAVGASTCTFSPSNGNTLCPCATATSPVDDVCLPRPLIPDVPRVSPCFVADTILSPSSNYIIDPSCTNVTYLNVTLSSTLSASISKMKGTHPSQLTLLFSNCILLSGSVLVIDSISSSSASEQYPPSPISISISNSVAVDGALVLQGQFGAGAVILVSNVSMTISSNATALKLAASWDGATSMSSIPKALMLYNLSLSDGASLLVTNSTFNSSIDSVLVYMYLFAGLSLINKSLMLWSNISCGDGMGSTASIYIASSTISVDSKSWWRVDRFSGSNIQVKDANMSLSGGSGWIIGNSTFNSSAGPLAVDAISFKYASLTVAGGSLWALENVNLVTNRYPSNTLLFQFTSVVLVAGSTWSISRCFLSSANSAMAWTSSPIMLSGNSTWYMGASSIDGVTSAVTFVSALRMNVSAWSSITWTSSAFRGRQSAGLRLASGNVTIDQNSVWLLTNSTIYADAGYPVVGVGMTMSIGMNSWVSWSSMNMSSPSVLISGCIFSFYTIFQSPGAYFTFFENSCNLINRSNITAVAIFTNAQLAGNSSALSSPFYQRCNTLNGFITVKNFPTPFSTPSNTTCYACDATLDCFRPLVQRNASCSRRGDGSAVCPCLAGGGLLCSPSATKDAPLRSQTLSISRSYISTSHDFSGTTTASLSVSSTASSTGRSATIKPSRHKATSSVSFYFTFSGNHRERHRTVMTHSESTISPFMPSQSLSSTVSSITYNGAKRSGPVHTRTHTGVLCHPFPTAVLQSAALRMSTTDASLLSNASLSTANSSTSSFPIVVPLGGSVPMAAVFSAAGATVEVVFVAAPGLIFRDVSNYSSSLGFVLRVNHSTPLSGGDINDTVSLFISVANVDVSTIAASSTTTLTVSVDVTVVAAAAATVGLCSQALSTTLTYQCSLSPLRTQVALKEAVQKTFQATTTTSSILGNPVSALSTTGMISILDLDECVLSDVEPLDPSVSPVGAAVGTVIGQYYRGAVVTAVGMIVGSGILGITVSFLVALVARDRGVTLNKVFGFLRFPSSMMIVVGVFHQGMVTSATSLFRVAQGPIDILLGVLGISFGAAATVFVWLATTRWRKCHVARRHENLPLLRASRVLQLVIWNCHWVDDDATNDPSAAGYKRRYFLFLDDLQDPWWTALELSSGVIQGSILGVRRNDLTACQIQRFVLATHCALMLGAASALRPCGSVLGNVFLILSKLGSFLVALLIVIHTTSGDARLSRAAQMTTAVFAFISSVQTVVQLFLVSLLAMRTLPSMLQSFMRWLKRDDAANGYDRQVRVINVANLDDDKEDEDADEELATEFMLPADDDASNRSINNAEMAQQVLSMQEEGFGMLQLVPQQSNKNNNNSNIVEDLEDDQWMKERARLQKEVQRALQGKNHHNPARGKSRGASAVVTPPPPQHQQSSDDETSEEDVDDRRRRSGGSDDDDDDLFL